MDGVTAFDKNADEYDRWFDENKQVYQAEVRALERFVRQRQSGSIYVGCSRSACSVPSLPLSRLSGLVALCKGEIGRKIESSGLFLRPQRPRGAPLIGAAP